MKKKIRDILNKAAKKTSEIVDQGLEKAVDLSEHKKIPEYAKKILEKTTEKRTTKMLIIEGAVGVTLGIVTGGALLPVAAGALAQGLLTKEALKRFNEKKAARKGANDDETPTDAPQPAPEDASLPAPKKGPKNGSQPQ